MSTSRPSRSLHRHARIASGAILAATLLACAGAAGAPDGSASPAPAASRESVVRRPDTPPRVVSQSAPLRIMQVVRVPAGQTPGTMPPSDPDLSYSVVVRADGRADIGTLQVGGVDGRANRDAIIQWLMGVKFAPALLGGQPVAAEFRVRR